MTEKARYFTLQLFNRKDNKFEECNPRIKAETLVDAMNYASAIYPHFKNNGVDWMVNGVIGMFMRSNEYILYLTDIEAMKYDLDNITDN